MSEKLNRSLFYATIDWMERVRAKAQQAGAKYEIETQRVGDKDICRATIFYPDGGIEKLDGIFTFYDALFPSKH